MTCDLKVEVIYLRILLPLICLSARRRNGLASVRIVHVSGKTISDHLHLVLHEQVCDEPSVVTDQHADCRSPWATTVR